MSDVKQVKVDNWGIYFLQRLKHFFNRTDYCDLTLQFQDNAQLKVHRLVLNACTEYFELLERTCEMYEDCLVMPDDLQADVVVPIVNFMYTGHLEFRMDLLERLYQTSQVLNMPVLTKLLESHRNLAPKAPTHSYSGVKRFTKHIDPKTTKTSTPVPSTSHKRSYSKAFDNNITYRDKKTYQSITRTESVNNNTTYRPPSPISMDSLASHKVILGEPRPTRYEIPEELDADNIFDNSFCNISYTSQPLMVHPDTVKRYKPKRSGIFGEPSSSKRNSGMSTVDIVECKKIKYKEDSLFDDSAAEHNLNDDSDLFNASYLDVDKDPNQLFDQILDNDGPKVTIETKDSKAASNLDHARIISEVLKKYPHLVKSNKNIKLKILDPIPGKGKKQQKPSPNVSSIEDKPPLKLKTEDDDCTYETDVLDSKQAARLIAMGAENIKGPWICLICGTPGKALHFGTYYKFRRHLVEVHHEKPVSTICEYCGLRSTKRNYLMHHLYTHHGVPPPPQYQFPKCNLCSYIALTEGLLVKHKLSHKDHKGFRCNVCSTTFATSNQLLTHIQNTGHKYTADRKNNLQCIYCLKVFLREANLYAHIKTNHKKEATNDCIIEDSDEEKPVEERPRTKSIIKFEPSTSYDNEYEETDLQYPIQASRSIGDIQVSPRKQQKGISTNQKQKILNPGFDSPKPAIKAKPSKFINHNQSLQNEFLQDMKMSTPSNSQEEEIVIIDNNEYIMKDNQLIPRKQKPGSTDLIITDVVEVEHNTLQSIQQPTTSVEYTNIQNTNIEQNVQQSNMIIKKSTNINQPIQIVVSNEEEYKALMASNHPIIFDNGEANKTLTVLTAPHHSQAMDTSAIDLDTSQSDEMMILPHEYPLNVTEAVPTENSNIVVVYSHPVDDQNKQFQILTTGGIGAQFVQSSATITQNYETVTTSAPAMTAHCIGTQIGETWQGDIQTLDGQQIQLPSHAVMQNVVHSNQLVLKAVHNETGENLGDLPEVNLVSGSQTVLPSNETDMNLNPSDVVVDHVDQTGTREMVEESSNARFIEKENTLSENESVESSQSKPMPVILNNDENVEVSMEIDGVLTQPMITENVAEQQIETENILEQPIVTENIIEQPIESKNIMEQSLVIENVTEEQIETENVLAQPTQTKNIIQQSLELENVLEQPLCTNNLNEQTLETQNVLEQSLEHENVSEKPLETQNVMEQLETENILEQPMVINDADQTIDHTKNIIVTQTDSENIEQQYEIVQSAATDNIVKLPVASENLIEQTIGTDLAEESSLHTEVKLDTDANTEDSVNLLENAEIERFVNMNTSEGEFRKPIEAENCDDNVEINSVNVPEPKQPEEKIDNLAMEWSEDEYEVAENPNNIAKNVVSENAQKLPVAEEPELEESIENIEQEVRKQMSCAAEPEVETEESAVSSQEEDSSSQELQLPPLVESPVTVIQNPQAQQKISSLLNDWEDNDSQEEMIPPQESHKKLEEPTENTAKLASIPKNDNIKSLVSDWDEDDEEETK